VKVKVARKKGKAGDGYPSRSVYFEQQHKEDGRNLGECVRFAKDAGTKVTESGDSIEHGARQQDRNVRLKTTTVNFHGILCRIDSTINMVLSSSLSAMGSRYCPNIVCWFYYSLAYSAFACVSIGISGSASNQTTRKAA
jgi:hypothetical protein